MKQAFCNKNDGHLIVLLSVKMNSKQILFGKLFLTEVDLKHFMISEHINCQTYISKVAIAVVLKIRRIFMWEELLLFNHHYFRGLPKKIIFLKVIQARPYDSIHDLVIHYRLRPSQYLSIYSIGLEMGVLANIRTYSFHF